MMTTEGIKLAYILRGIDKKDLVSCIEVAHVPHVSYVSYVSMVLTRSFMLLNQGKRLSNEFSAFI